MVPVCYVDASPSAQLAFVMVVEEADAMQIVEIPFGRSILAVDFERIEGLVPARVASSFERSSEPFSKRARNALASSIPTG
jgi:hypothetical protein